MNIFISGGLGFVGRHLSRGLLKAGHQVTAVGRTQNPQNAIRHDGFTYLTADTTQPGGWQDRLRDSDVVVNLAGHSIFTLWTENAKRKIYDSRILTTRNLAEALADAGPTIFISTSAVGFYGDRGDVPLTEAEPSGDDFLAEVAKDWEAEALRAESEHTRVILTRLGIVLGEDGGAMAKMVPAFRWFLGGRLGSGRQWFPWIHVEDLVAAYRFVIDHNDIRGPVNCCAPNPVRNRELTEVLAKSLGRPALLPVPAFAVRMLLGEFGQSLLASLRADPAVLRKVGFPFRYPDLRSAVREIVSG